ncbi:MAG: S41 family peptidase [Candidatus Azobacteroides sp.]|nr:S41 family peptidase [Candidatus Azobacteroides sp.]
MKNKSSLRAILLLVVGIIVGVVIGINMYRLPFGRLKNVVPGDKINSLLYLINKQYVDTVNINQLVENAIPDILKGLDPHSVYISAQDLADVNNTLEGHFSGIGVQFTIQDDTINIVSVVRGGPSEKAGLQAGDRIIEVNDSVFVGKNISNEKVMKELRGPKESVVKLGIKRSSSETLLTFKVIRDDIPVQSVDVAYKISDGIGYIKVNQFGRNTYKEFMDAITRLTQKENCNKLIIDLRENTGGYMEAATAMVNEFLANGQAIMYIQGKTYPKKSIYADGYGSCQKIPIVVLIDEFSASASEIFAGAIQDNDRGLIVGRRSFGKGMVQQQIELSDGSAVRLTVARYYTPSGRCIQKYYENGADNNYESDILNRYKHGEFDSQDSIKQNLNLKYKTVSGRTVYGGGGIMPDIFVPRDTAGYTSYFHTLINQGVLYQFAFQYSDKNRSVLNNAKDYKQLLAYLETQDLLEDLVSFAETKGIKRRPVLIDISKNLILNQLYAYIIRNKFENEGFYPIFQRQDKTLARAVEELKSGQNYPSSPALTTKK